MCSKGQQDGSAGTVLGSKPDDLSSRPRCYTVEGQSQLLQVVL